MKVHTVFFFVIFIDDFVSFWMKFCEEIAEGFSCFFSQNKTDFFEIGCLKAKNFQVKKNKSISGGDAQFAGEKANEF